MIVFKYINADIAELLKEIKKLNINPQGYRVYPNNRT